MASVNNLLEEALEEVSLRSCYSTSFSLGPIHRVVETRATSTRIRVEEWARFPQGFLPSGTVFVQTAVDLRLPRTIEL